MRELTEEQREVTSNLKATLWYSVSKMVEHEISLLNADANTEITATETFIASMVELVYNQAISLGEDLESFARHAKRKTINMQDLYMVTRRNSVLTEELQKFERGELEQPQPTQDEMSDLDDEELEAML